MNVNCLLHFTDSIMENSFSSVPAEIFEYVCSFLSFSDIGRLELSGKSMSNKIEDSRVWRKQVERFNCKFDYKLVQQMLDYTKQNEVNLKYYKIILGMTGNIRKAEMLLEDRERIYREQIKTEFEKIASQENALNSKSFNVWMTKVVKICLQEELVKAKILQILSYSDEVSFLKTAAGTSAPQPAATDTRVASVFQSEDPDVTDQIQTFAHWIEERIAPTEAEVILCAKTKAAAILQQVHLHFSESDDQDQI